MTAKVLRRINCARVEIVIDERDPNLVFLHVVYWSEPDECGACGTTAGIKWSGRVVNAKTGNQTFIYKSRTCPTCRAQSDTAQDVSGAPFWKRWAKVAPRPVAEAA